MCRKVVGRVGTSRNGRRLIHNSILNLGGRIMEKVKLSTLSKDEILSVDGEIFTVTVEGLMENIERYRDMEIYTTIPNHASFNAKEIIDDAIEDVQCNDMYEDWDERIHDDVTEQDIKDIQTVFDRILARSPNQNISYVTDKLIEFDI